VAISLREKRQRDKLVKTIDNNEETGNASEIHLSHCKKGETRDTNVRPRATSGETPRTGRQQQRRQKKTACSTKRNKKRNTTQGQRERRTCSKDNKKARRKIDMDNNPVVEARGTRGKVAPSARGEEMGLSAAVCDSGIGCSAQCLEQRQHLHVTTRSHNVDAGPPVRVGSAHVFGSAVSHDTCSQDAVSQLVSQLVSQQQQPETFEKK
jgi:hypothetical protein